MSEFAFNIEKVKTGTLVDYVNNSRTHTQAQVDKVAASIKEFGFINPIITDGKNGVIAGHCRLAAAKKLGLDEVPTICASHLTETQRRAYVIADNRLALDAGWDDEILKIELGSLASDDFDIDLLGFSDDEIDDFLKYDKNESDGNIEKKDQEYKEIFAIFVECKDEMEQEALFHKLDSEGYKCRVQSL